MRAPRTQSNPKLTETRHIDSGNQQYHAGAKHLWRLQS